MLVFSFYNRIPLLRLLSYEALHYVLEGQVFLVSVPGFNFLFLPPLEECFELPLFFQPLLDVLHDVRHRDDVVCDLVGCVLHTLSQISQQLSLALVRMGVYCFRVLPIIFVLRVEGEYLEVVDFLVLPVLRGLGQPRQLVAYVFF